ncbi:MAG: antitoxin MazE family protein [Janthinobacterium lividum]
MAATGTGAQRVRRRRDKLKAAGLRPVQIWVPDTRAPGFAQECVRQSRMIQAAEGQGDPDHDAWSDATDVSGWTA